MKIQKITGGANVAPLLWALQAHPNLWDERPQRTSDPKSPHYGLHDIWVRYAAPEHVGKEGDHESIWYPCETILPYVKAIVYPLMHLVEGDRLGGVLITKIPAGKTCKPHIDKGWHASTYRKFGVQIQSSPGQRFHVEEQSLEPMPGDVYEFVNSFEHWVTNDTPHDRITMIVCIQTEKKFRGEN